MKRRLFALMLALAMLCPMVLAGCNSGDSKDTDNSSVQETTTRETVSINMWVVTDEKTTAEAQAAVEEAFNTITKSTYTTYVDLIFVTADEYAETLNAKFQQADELKAQGGSKKPAAATTETDGETTEALETNEYGVTVLKYPEISEGQIDIVFINGMEQLVELVEQGRLQNLNTHISETGAAKVLTDVIPSELLTYSKINSGTYGIPNNRVVGEYTYLLVNKDIVTGDANGDGTVSGDEISGTYCNIDDISTFFDCENLIEYIKTNRSDLVPVLEEFNNPYIHYWSEDGEFSILASKKSFVSQASDFNPEYGLKNVFSIDEFTEFELLMKKYETGSYFAKDVEATKQAQNFGVAVMTGDSAIVDEYSENYYVKVISNPTLNNDNLFTSFYGITNYCGNVDRALEIITMLNTDSELRNVLQYGVEGVHYELDENDRVERFNNDYIMNLEDTGNVFIAYPEEGMDDDVWERGVKTNLDIKIDPLTGLWSVWSQVDSTIISNLAKQSKAFKDRMDACKTVDELTAFFETAKTEAAMDAAFVAATNSENTASYKAVYSSWYTKNWPATDA